VRIKEPDGPGGLLDSLTTANAAAPLALPDLVALPRPALETAALKGLVHPFSGLSEPIDAPDLFEYAQQLARLQDSTFGIPFAGDALILVYRPSVLGQPPEDLTSALSSSGPLAFPAADPQALFTLALYQAAGGDIRDEQGRPILQADILEEVLKFYQDGSEAEFTPFWLTQLQTDEQAWGEFTEQNAPQVITWLSRYLNSDQADLAAAPLPTLEGNDYTLSNGWVWALGSADPERQRLAAELAEFLSEADFLARWDAATGYLPPRASGLENWRDAALQPLALSIAQSARLNPAGDLLASLAPVLQQATIEVLKKQTDPQAAAQRAADSLALP
jgi:ABC-type glycerol-3-phosphate transport system substrate-binding protein